MAATNPITFKELLNYTTGKSNASRQEFESAIASRGYKPGDIRKLGKAYDRVKESGNEYVLHPTKGFNVYDPDNKQLSGSGKNKGNKAGFDLGDLIGLGGDVSLLAGALRNEVKGYTDSKAPKTAEVKPESVSSMDDTTKTSVNPDKDTNLMFGNTTGQKPKQGQRAGGPQANKSGATQPDNFDLSDFIKAPEKQESKGYTTYQDIFGPDGEPVAGSKKSKVSGTESVLNNILAGMHGTTNWTTNKLAGLAEAFGTPREEQQLFEPAHKAADEYEKARMAGTNEDDTFGSVAGAIPGVLASGRLWPFGKTRAASNFVPAAKAASNKVFRGAKNLYEKYPLSGRTNLRKPSVNDFRSPFPEHAGDYRDGGLLPDEENYPSLKFNDIGELIPTEEGEILMSAEKGAKLTPDEINYPSLRFNDIGELIPTEEGEILLSGRKGMKMPDMRGLMLYGEDGLKFNDDELQAPIKSVAGNPDTSLLGWHPDFNATQKERPVVRGIRPEGNNAQGRPFDWSNLASGLVKYGVPATYLGAEHNQVQNLRKLINPHLTAPDLMTGAVKDLPHPDFSLPYQPGMEGSSLEEAQASGLARAKFQREGQTNWELKNALNRQEQQNHIIDRLNQNAVLKAQTGNQEAMIKSGNAMNEFGYLLQDRGQTAGSLFQNLDQGITGKGIEKDRNARLAATHIIESGKGSDEDQQWAREVLGIGKSRKKGGKLGKTKTKFSNAYA